MLCQTQCPLSAQHRRRSRMQHRGQGSRWAGAPPQLGRAVTSVAKGGEWGPPLRLPRWAERPAAARASRAQLVLWLGRGLSGRGAGSAQGMEQEQSGAAAAGLCKWGSHRDGGRRGCARGGAARASCRTLARCAAAPAEMQGRGAGGQGPEHDIGASRITHRKCCQARRARRALQRARAARAQRWLAGLASQP